MIIGAQLYTLRNSCKTLEDFAETLKKVADIGYKAVQISGVCPYEGAWLKEELDKNGLTAPLTHTPFKEITEQTEATLQKHRAFGCHRIGLGSAPGGIGDETYDGFEEAIAPAVRYFAENGAKFYYHNHWQEFVRSEKDGKYFIDKLCERFASHELGIVLDTYWVQFSGGDPIAWLKKLDGRVDSIHFKDMVHKNKEHRMVPVGEGNLNWEGIIRTAYDVGTKYAFVEQDNCNGEDPFDCMKRSYEFLKAQGLE